MAQDGLVEVVNGALVEMSPNGIQHHLMAGNIYDLIQPDAKSNKLGRVFMDGLIYRLRGDDDEIIEGRIPEGFDIAKPFPGTPDFAVEVLSPSDNADELLEKVRSFLELGTQ